MFGFVMANGKELTKEENMRYSAVYCGICRQIRLRSGNLCRLGLSYDLTFLSLLLMSLYEPEESSGSRACGLHPLRPRSWVENPYIVYAADMNVALAYYNAMDDYQDEGKHTARWATELFGKDMDRIKAQYPRQCGTIARCLEELRHLENSGCADPDAPAACFGALLGEILVYDPADFWVDKLREIGDSLGRFIYLADAAVDYRRDIKKHQYNPFDAMGTGEDWVSWEEYLVLAMGRCTKNYEQLPLVQDKKILDNILYSGIWLVYRQKQRKGQS